MLFFRNNDLENTPKLMKAVWMDFYDQLGYHGGWNEADYRSHLTNFEKSLIDVITKTRIRKRFSVSLIKT